MLGKKALLLALALILSLGAVSVTEGEEKIGSRDPDDPFIEWHNVPADPVEVA